MADQQADSHSLDDLLDKTHALADDLRKSPRRGGDALAHIHGNLTTLLRSADLVLALDEAVQARQAVSQPEPSQDLVFNIGRLVAQGLLDLHSGRLSPEGSRHSIPCVLERGPGSRLVLAVGTPRHRQKAEIVTTKPKFGGVRYWFQCPGLPGASCGRRVMLLYQPTPFGRLACRRCHDGREGDSASNTRDALAVDIERANAQRLRRAAGG